MAQSQVTIYTDGSCLGNPGPGGWAAVVIKDGKELELSGGAPETTNNRMELMGAISALTAVGSASVITVISDSQYLVRAFNENWVKSWKSRGWSRADGELKNRDLWMLLDKLVSRHEITWKWVKGHAGNKYNERCDKLAVKQSRYYQKNGDCPIESNLGPKITEEEEPAQTEMQEVTSRIPETPPTENLRAEKSAQQSAPKDTAAEVVRPANLNSNKALEQEKPVKNTSSLMDELPYLQQMLEFHSKTTTGITFPCGNFDWCEKCKKQMPENNKSNCAMAYVKYIDEQQIGDKEI